jgi:hypothetical protein
MNNLQDRIVGLSPARRELLLQMLERGGAQKTSGHFTIPRREPGVPPPLSFAQERLWVSNKLDAGSSAYNITVALSLVGNLDPVALRRSLVEIVGRHEALRTTFSEVDGRPVQVISPQMALELPLLDMSDEPDAEQRIAAIISEEAERKFDLANGPLFLARLLRRGPDNHLLLISTHHIIFDGWSISVLLNELTTLYQSFASGLPSPLPELQAQYADFAIWQRRQMEGERLNKLLGYWKKQLGPGLPKSQLAVKNPPSGRLSKAAGRRHFSIPGSLSSALLGIGAHEGGTLFMVLLAALKILLQRHSRQDEIVVGSEIANRNVKEIEGLIGFFVNILVLRTNLSGSPSFRELLRRVREVAVGAYAHQDLPFEKLVAELQPERSLNRTPLFQTMFVLQNAPPARLRLPGLEVTPIGFEDETTKFDLILVIQSSDQGLRGAWYYNQELFEDSMITQMAGQFETLLKSIAANPDERISRLETLTELEKTKLIVEKEKRKQTKSRKLLDVKPKAVNLSTMRLVDTDSLTSGEPFPLIVKPVTDEVDLANWSRSNHEYIEANLLKYGAILFRGFRIDSEIEFERCAKAVCPELFSEYGDLPRQKVGGNIYTSTPYPADQAILLHNESSQMHCWPLKIWFHCAVPAEKGGETPIIDCRKVYQRLDPRIRDQFERKGVRYIRNFVQGMDVDWADFFGSSDKKEVEAYCKAAGLDFEWTEGNGLRTRKTTLGVAVHPKTGEKIFFNQIQAHHPSCMDPAVHRAMLALFKESDLPRNCRYGDGTPIEDSVMAEIADVYRELSVSFPWQKGDLMLLDNMLSAHGRKPYVGARKILVTMGEMVTQSQIQLKMKGENYV